MKVCGKCGISLRLKKSGIPCVETYNNLPLRIWFADVWVCLKCGTEIVTGFGPEPYAEYYMSNFDEALEVVTTLPHLTFSTE